MVGNLKAVSLTKSDFVHLRKVSNIASQSLGENCVTQSVSHLDIKERKLGHEVLTDDS